MWEDYKKLHTQEKKSYFAVIESPEGVSLRSFVQPEASIKGHNRNVPFVIDAGRHLVETNC